MIIVITGDGKGKTTSALGQALRVIGEGKRAIMIQFIKGPWVTGEDKAAKRLEPDFRIVKGGKGFVGIMGDRLPRSEHEKAARATLRLAGKTLRAGGHQLLILDEINVALSLKLIKLADVLALLKSAPKSVTIMLTGRDAPKALCRIADLVSEVREIKHPYRRGKRAQHGVEF